MYYLPWTAIQETDWQEIPILCVVKYITSETQILAMACIEC